MPVAQRIYANALFEAAKEQDRLRPVTDDLHAFAEAVEQVHELRALLENPEVDSLEKTDALRAILADADELVRNFLLLVVEKGRIHELDEMLAEFDALVAAEEGILDVELTTAVELSEDETLKILRQIEQVSGRRLRASRRVEPALLGGFVLQAGSYRADASVRGRLDRLRRQLTGSGRS
ncbi:MAG TPA: ATP synthase F1 subunit delta [Gaiellaceae bacterium]|nr:ATP synthase F1 subunit delta [Gaiellaceae bacterium]